MYLFIILNNGFKWNILINIIKKNYLIYISILNKYNKFKYNIIK